MQQSTLFIDNLKQFYWKGVGFQNFALPKRTNRWQPLKTRFEEMRHGFLCVCVFLVHLKVKSKLSDSNDKTFAQLFQVDVDFSLTFWKACINYYTIWEQTCEFQRDSDVCQDFVVAALRFLCEPPPSDVHNGGSKRRNTPYWFYEGNWNMFINVWSFQEDVCQW